MYRLIKITAYQLLLLLIGVPFTLILLFALLESLINFPLVFAAAPFMMLFCMAIYFGWHWAVAIFLSKRSGQKDLLDLKVFKTGLICFFLYILMSVVFIFLTDLDVVMYKLFAFVRFVATIGYFYCLAFIARKLNQIEEGRALKLSDWIYDMLVLLVFPVGIFVIQPRIHSLRETNSKVAHQ